MRFECRAKIRIRKERNEGARYHEFEASGSHCWVVAVIQTERPAVTPYLSYQYDHGLHRLIAGLAEARPESATGVEAPKVERDLRARFRCWNSKTRPECLGRRHGGRVPPADASTEIKNL